MNQFVSARYETSWPVRARPLRREIARLLGDGVAARGESEEGSTTDLSPTSRVQVSFEVTSLIVGAVVASLTGVSRVQVSFEVDSSMVGAIDV